MAERLDEIDRRILYHLMAEARHTKAPEIADEVNVTPATIRNRLAALEEQGVITGYHADVDFEEAGDLLTQLYICTAPEAKREALAEQVLQIPAVVEVRSLVAGQGNLHVVGVGGGTDDITHIGKALSELGLEIEDEALLQRTQRQAYQPFAPDDQRRRTPTTDFISLKGGAEVVEFTVADDAPLANKTLAKANEEGLIDDDVLVIAVEREGDLITPRGNTEIRPNDVITVFSRDGDSGDVAEQFTGP